MAGDEKENRDESEPSPRVVRRCAEESEDDGDAGTRNRLGLKRVKLRYRFGVGEIDEEKRSKLQDGLNRASTAALRHALVDHAASVQSRCCR